MIKHIVMWKLKEENKQQNIANIKSMLENLVGKIDGLLSAEVGVNVVVDNDAFDAVLVSTFDSLDALHAYKTDPQHVVVSAFVKSVRTDRKTVDYYI